MNQKELRDGIDKLDWCPGGEAAVLYREFLKAPFYDSPAGTYTGEKDTYSTDDPDRFWNWD